MMNIEYVKTRNFYSLFFDIYLNIIIIFQYITEKNVCLLILWFEKKILYIYIKLIVDIFMSLSNLFFVK